MVTVTKGDLIALGYGPSFAADIIRGNKKAYGIKGTYILPVTETVQSSQRSCGRITGDYDSRQTELIVLLAHLCEE